MIRIKTQLIAVFLVCATAAHVYGNDIQYTITDLGVLASAPSNGGSYATAINNAGEVVGYGDTYTLYSHAFLYPGSAPLINLGSFGGDYSVSSATAINNSGMVVGYSDSSGAGSPTRAFLYTQSDGMRDLATFGGAQAVAKDINNLGQVVGYAQAPDGMYHGFLYSGTGPMIDLGSTYLPFFISDAGQIAAVGGSGTQTSTYVSSGGTGTWVNIGSLGGNDTQPYGMNDHGAVVGGSATNSNSNTFQPFLYSGGTMTDLGTFGGQYGIAMGINDYGVVVGGANLPGDSAGHGFVYYAGGQIEDLNNLVDPALRWTIDDALAVNDQGQIAAEAQQENGYYHAVLLTPTPEPSSLYLLAVAGFIILAVRGRTSLKRLWGSN